MALTKREKQIMRYATIAAIVLSVLTGTVATSCSSQQSTEQLREDAVMYLGDAEAIAGDVQTVLEENGDAEAAAKVEEVTRYVRELRKALEAQADVGDLPQKLAAAYESAKNLIPEKYRSEARLVRTVVERVFVRLERRGVFDDDQPKETT